ncbi:MAG: winged helix-turn-helix domain-containing protein [Gammaproteobacteria bacterium]|nr:winged helix-turn-helix domain-containing protein [Gammaproteobacteria bacterium]
MQANHQCFYLNDCRVSPAEGDLLRADEIIHLEPKAMEVLVYLVLHAGQVVSREELEREVWHGALVGYDAVTNTIIKLRKALEDDPRKPRFIATVPKRGYRLIVTPDFRQAKLSPQPAELVSPLTASAIPPIPDPLTGPVTARPREAASSRQSVKHRITGLALLLGIGVAIISLWLADDNTKHIEVPSIIVLPFDNLSHEPAQETFADGITEDIITDLSRLSSLFVLATNTSFSYKGKQVLPQDVGEELSVSYVLKGSVRPFGDKLRMTVQLVDARTGFNVWAERYDRNRDEIFTVQDEVLQSIVSALAVTLSSQEQQRLEHRTTNSLVAYDYFQEGQRLFKISSSESYEEAQEMYRKAIEYDPSYGRAYGALSVLLSVGYRSGWTASPLESQDRALVLAKKAVELDPSIPQTYWALSFIHLGRKEYRAAKEAISKAIDIAPNYADGLGLMAIINAYEGNPKEAIKLNDKAVKLNPYYSYEYLITYGIAYYHLKNYDKAVEVLERAYKRNTNHIHIRILLTASYIGAGQQDEAEWLVSELALTNPAITVSSVKNTIPFSSDKFENRILADLKQAGMKN